MSIRRTLSLALFSLLLPVHGTVNAQIIDFGYPDVYPNDPVQEALVYLTGLGIVEGYEDGSFRPFFSHQSCRVH